MSGGHQAGSLIGLSGWGCGHRGLSQPARLLTTAPPTAEQFPSQANVFTMARKWLDDFVGETRWVPFKVYYETQHSPHTFTLHSPSHIAKTS